MKSITASMEATDLEATSDDAVCQVASNITPSLSIERDNSPKRDEGREKLAGFSIKSEGPAESIYSSAVFIFVVGQEQQAFAVYEFAVGESEVLAKICHCKKENEEPYRIELPEVSPHTFAGIVEWLYEDVPSVRSLLEYAPEGDGPYLGNLYIFATEYKMSILRSDILTHLRNHGRVRLLLEAAVKVYKRLGRDELFSPFFLEQFGVQIELYIPPLGEGPGGFLTMNELITDFAAEGGEFGADLTKASLSALLSKKEIRAPVEQCWNAPARPNDGWNRSPIKSPPVAPTATALALQDWDGGYISRLAFPRGAKITNVETRRPQSAEGSGPDLLWHGMYNGVADYFPSKYVQLEGPVGWQPPSALPGAPYAVQSTEREVSWDY